MNILLAIIIGYLLGNINGPYLLGKLFKGIDIRDKGTSNPGATNAMIVMGWKIGALSFLIDMLKAASAIWIVKYLTGSTDLSVLAGVMAMVGHIFPVFMGFKGGKGVASLLGIMLGLSGYIFIILGITVIIGAFITNYLYWGELLMLILFPVAAYLLGYSNITVLLIVAACLFSAYKLRENLFRTLKGTEQSVSDVFFKKK